MADEIAGLRSMLERDSDAGAPASRQGASVWRTLTLAATLVVATAAVLRATRGGGGRATEEEEDDPLFQPF